MCTPFAVRSIPVFTALLLSTAFGSAHNVDANDWPSLAQVLPLSQEDVDDVELVDDWMDDTIALVGTPYDDKISIVVDDDQIRFFVNGDFVGRVRDRDLPDEPVGGGVPVMGADTVYPLRIIVSGGQGNDDISLQADHSDGPAINLYNRAFFLLYGDDGDDALTSRGIDQAIFVGGTGTDLLVGDGMNAQYFGCESVVQDIEKLVIISLADSSKDVIVPLHAQSTAYRNYYLPIQPVSYTVPTVVGFERTPRKLPGVPTIVSREKLNTTVYDPEPIVFDSILLDRDLVLNDIGCLVMDLHFREDGSILDRTVVE